MLSSCFPSNYKYRITNSEGDDYFCNFYKVTTDGCIMFNDKPGYSNTPGIPTIICDDYKIKQLR